MQPVASLRAAPLAGNRTELGLRTQTGESGLIVTTPDATNGVAGPGIGESGVIVTTPGATNGVVGPGTGSK